MNHDGSECQEILFGYLVQSGLMSFTYKPSGDGDAVHTSALGSQDHLHRISVYPRRSRSYARVTIRNLNITVRTLNSQHDLPPSVQQHVYQQSGISAILLASQATRHESSSPPRFVYEQTSLVHPLVLVFGIAAIETCHRTQTHLPRETSIHTLPLARTARTHSVHYLHTSISQCPISMVEKEKEKAHRRSNLDFLKGNEQLTQPSAINRSPPIQFDYKISECSYPS